MTIKSVKEEGNLKLNLGGDAMSDETSKLRETWDNIWKNTPYGHSDKRLCRSQEKIDNLLEMGVCFNPGQCVLDAGCGNGIALACLEKMFQILPFGIDISSEVLKTAEKTALDLGVGNTFKQGDIRSIPFENDKFDFVMSWGVIEHFFDYELAIDEFYRVLRPGATLNLVQPNKFSLRHLKKFYLELTGQWEFDMQINFSPNFLCSLLRKKGFRNIRFVVKPYRGSRGIINSMDALFNRFNRNCGYYLYILADK